MYVTEISIFITQKRLPVFDSLIPTYFLIFDMQTFFVYTECAYTSSLVIIFLLHENSDIPSFVPTTNILEAKLFSSKLVK